MPKTAINGVELYYQFDGLQEGKTIVFVNGLLTDRRSWSPHISELENEYKILTYDARGQRKSEKPKGPYPIETHTNDLAGLLDHLGISGACCVGLSNGAAVLLRLAITRPDLVHRLVVCDGYSHVDPLLKAKLQAWEAAARVSSDLRFLVATPFVWSNQFIAKNQPLLDYYREKASSFPKDASVALIEGAQIHDVKLGLPKITCPTLVVVGDEDILTPKKYSEYIANAIPNAIMTTMTGVGHAASIEQPVLFCDIIRDFLAEG